MDDFRVTYKACWTAALRDLGWPPLLYCNMSAIETVCNEGVRAFRKELLKPADENIPTHKNKGVVCIGFL